MLLFALKHMPGGIVAKTHQERDTGFSGIPFSD